MKTEAILRLQAYLDNEVSSAEARQIASWISRDAEAQALYEELKATKSLLNPANELAVKLPEPPDFYWSKIQRAIGQTEQEPARRHSPRPWWIRLLAPVAGAAALAVFVFTSVSFNGITGHYKEVSETDNSITFYSPEQKMTVVWIPSGKEEVVASADESDD